MLDFKIIINSSINYYDKACKFLLDSFFQNFPNYPKENIYIFLGGGNLDEGYIRCDNESINKYIIPHNSFDYNGLISILDLGINPKYFFYLHDTCLVGELFLKGISEFNPDHLCKPVLPIASMNIGMYNYDLIEKFKEHILAIKNCDYSPEGIQKSKRTNIDIENFLFRNNFSETYCDKPEHLDDYKNHYGTGTNRIVEYYRKIDLIKLKANFQHREEWVVQL